MLDPRSIDTILYWLINNMNFNKIVFSNKIHQKLPTDFQYDVFYSKTLIIIMIIIFLLILIITKLFLK